MDAIFSRELDLIKKPIEQLIVEQLNEGFKNRKGRTIESIERVSILDISIDEEKSSFKESIIVTSIVAHARVWVHFHDGRTNDQLQLSLSKNVILEYNLEAKEYIIQNPDEIELVDRSF